MTQGGGLHPLAVDAAAVVFASAAICLLSDRLWAMTLLLPSLFLARMVAWSRCRASVRGHGLGVEIALVAICTALGAVNDEVSVALWRVYDYTVPTFAGGPPAIPIWMLLYWGLILRFLVSLGDRPVGRPARDELHLLRRVIQSGRMKLLFQVGLVAITRPFVYRCAADPILSWFPLLLALLAYLLLFRPDRFERTLLFAALAFGPAVEILYIQVGHLHRYALGWIYGVPLWIVLWWGLAVLVWRDLSARLLHLLRRHGSLQVPPPISHVPGWTLAEELSGDGMDGASN